MRLARLPFVALAIVAIAACCGCNKQKIPSEEPLTGDYIMVDATAQGETLPNIVSNVNVWYMGKSYYHPKINQDANVFEFVEYVQFMQCTGGSTDRDLFRNPGRRDVKDDYYFDGLIKNCSGVLKMGAKPHLKLGSVPLKFTTDPVSAEFGTNIYPPDDYKEYYTYIKAVITALVEEFGLDEVRTWHFGCMTEYENYSWFKARSGAPDDSKVAFCKLYDYTVQALLDVLGDDVYVGAHSMTVTEGGWDERGFIEHCASGTNYANGGLGTQLCYLSASYYDYFPGVFTTGMDLASTVAFLREAAENCGLKGLKFGIDEGRLLCGVNAGSQSIELYNRTTGYTWQAAYDARLFKIGIDAGLDYFSSWNFLSGGNIYGYPTISFHVASNLGKMAGMRRAAAEVKFTTLDGAEADCLAATDGGTVRLMVYNFKNSLNYARKLNYTLRVKCPFGGSQASVTRYLVSDDCNFFDEWLKDRESMGITAADFGWSPDDPLLDFAVTLSNTTAISKYRTVRDKYFEYSRLVPVTETVPVNNGLITLDETLEASNVLFLEIKPL